MYAEALAFFIAHFLLIYYDVIFIRCIINNMATVKQLRAAKIMASHIMTKRKGRLTTGKILKEAGYSERSHSTLITNGKGFIEALNEALPDNMVVDIHKTSAMASRVSTATFPPTTTDEDIKAVIESSSGAKVKLIKRVGRMPITVYYIVPEHKSRMTALDMVYKLQGKYAAEKVAITDPYEDMTDEELAKKRQELEKQLKKRYDNTGSTSGAKKN